MMDTEEIKQLKLTNFLSEDNILLFRGKQSKEDVLNALIDQLAKNPDIAEKVDDVARGIFQREELLRTGIGNSLAVPYYHLHA